MKYRKRPIAVEAFEMTPEAMNREIPWPDWLEEAYNKQPGEVGDLEPVHERDPGPVTSEEIYTLEGPHIVIPDAWIIQGPAPTHEIWAVRDDIFRQTYEAVEED